jgi:hypothetical protein
MNTQDSRLPTLATELIEQLDDIYPERCPNPDHSEREIWMEAGERRLVRRLMDRLKMETDEYNMEDTIDV